MIAGSGCLYVHGNDRLPGDIDFYLPSSDHDKADTLFGIGSFTYKSPLEDVRNSNPEGDHSMQLTSALQIDKNGVVYSLEPTELVLGSKTEIVADGETFYFVPVEEALLIKALLGRGEDMGKQDIEDVKEFLKSSEATLSNRYIEARQAELGLPEDFFNKAIA